MRRAFYDRFGGDIPVKGGMIIEIKAKDLDEQPEMSFDEIIKDEICKSNCRLSESLCFGRS